jgi:hypothetical protein
MAFYFPIMSRLFMAIQLEYRFPFYKGHELIPIEIKSSRTFNSSLISGLKSFIKIELQIDVSILTLFIEVEEMKVGDIHLLNYRHAAQIVF